MNVGTNMNIYLIANPIGSTIGLVKVLKPKQIHTAVVARSPVNQINFKCAMFSFYLHVSGGNVFVMH